MYFRLHPQCVLVEGAKRGAIYNLADGKVHSINHGARELLKACREEPVSAIMDINSAENRPFIEFLQHLAELNLGSLYFNKPALPALPFPDEEPQRLDFLWLELTACCNNRCLHCYTASTPETEPEREVPRQRWLELIHEARQAGAAAIQLIGGEPLLYPHWQELTLKAREEGYEYIEIFTNATLVTDDCIDFFKAQQVHIATTLYADNAGIHDTVTGNPGSFEQTMAAINKLLAAGIPLRIASIIMKANEHQPEPLMALCTALGVDAHPPDVVRPTGRGDDQELLPEAYVKPGVKPPFYTDPHTFFRSHRYHSCLAGKIAVTPEGDVIPCIFARNRVCGNILEQPLAEILEGAPLSTCWRTTKDQVERCRDCEFRYACSDCRPLAQGGDPGKRWLACSCGCSYDPYIGNWEE